MCMQLCSLWNVVCLFLHVFCLTGDIDDKWPILKTPRTRQVSNYGFVSLSWVQVRLGLLVNLSKVDSTYYISFLNTSFLCLKIHRVTLFILYIQFKKQRVICLWSPSLVYCLLLWCCHMEFKSFYMLRIKMVVLLSTWSYYISLFHVIQVWTGIVAWGDLWFA
jgi:hypothetical protein